MAVLTFGSRAQHILGCLLRLRHCSTSDGLMIQDGNNVRHIVASSVLVKCVFQKILPGEFWWSPTVIMPVYLLGYPAGIWVGSGDDGMDRR